MLFYSYMLYTDLKPDNIAFTASGTLKIIDFGLSVCVHRRSPDSSDIYELTGCTGSYRYMVSVSCINYVT